MESCCVSQLFLWLQVAGMLNDLNLPSKYHALFQKEELDMGALSLMSDSDLEALGLSKGARLKLLNAIREKRESSTRPEHPA